MDGSPGRRSSSGARGLTASRASIGGHAGASAPLLAAHEARLAWVAQLEAQLMDLLVGPARGDLCSSVRTAGEEQAAVVQLVEACNRAAVAALAAASTAPELLEAVRQLLDKAESWLRANKPLYLGAQLALAASLTQQSMPGMDAGVHEPPPGAAPPTAVDSVAAAAPETAVPAALEERLKEGGSEVEAAAAGVSGDAAAAARRPPFPTVGEAEAAAPSQQQQQQQHEEEAEPGAEPLVAALQGVRFFLEPGEEDEGAEGGSDAGAADGRASGLPGATYLRLSALTASNRGCLLRQKGQLRSALRCFEHVLAIEWELEGSWGGGGEVALAGAGPDTAAAEDGSGGGAAATHLNVCAVLSSLGRHAEALQHAQAAVARLLPQPDPPQQHQAPAPDTAPAVGTGAAPPPLLATAYHSLGCQAERLRLPDCALEAFALAAVTAAAACGRGSPLHAAYQSELEGCQRRQAAVGARLGGSARGSGRPGMVSRPGSGIGALRGGSLGRRGSADTRDGRDARAGPIEGVEAAGASGVLRPSEGLLMARAPGGTAGRAKTMASKGPCAMTGARAGKDVRFDGGSLPSGWVVWDDAGCSPLMVAMQARAARLDAQVKEIGAEAYAPSSGGAAQ